MISNNHPQEKVSVIITTYNGESFIQEAIESLCNQSYKNLEILIVDDGSTDRTGELINQIADDRIKYFRTEHLGHVSALNYGLKFAQADYISILDHDDIAVCTKIEKQMKIIHDCPAIDIVSHNFFVMDSMKRVLFEIKLPEFDRAIKEELCLQNIVSHSGVLYKKSVILSVNGYREKYNTVTDYDLWLRLLDKAKFYNIQEPLLFYRKHKTALSYSLHALRKNNLLCISSLKENVLTNMKEPWIYSTLWQIRYGIGPKPIKNLLTLFYKRRLSFKYRIRFGVILFIGRNLTDLYYLYNPMLRLFYLKKYIQEKDTLVKDDKYKNH